MEGEGGNKNPDRPNRNGGGEANTSGSGAAGPSSANMSAQVPAPYQHVAGWGPGPVPAVQTQPQAAPSQQVWNPAVNPFQQPSVMWTQQQAGPGHFQQQVPMQFEPAPGLQWASAAGNPVFAAGPSAMLGWPRPMLPTFVQAAHKQGSGPAKRGRPVGSTNKKPAKSSNSKRKKRQSGEGADGDDSGDEDYVPPPPRRAFRRSPYLPPKRASEFNVPALDDDCCGKCSLYEGSYVMQPCGDYMACRNCVDEERVAAAASERDEFCVLCLKPVDSFLRAKRVTPTNFYEE